jgi:hypothetical protein
VTVAEFTSVLNLARFDIPQPTRNECTICIKSSPHGVFWFEQHDFHLSYAPFLKALPPELQMSRAAVEVNRYGSLLNPTVLCFAGSAFSAGYGAGILFTPLSHEIFLRHCL